MREHADTTGPPSHTLPGVIIGILCPTLQRSYHTRVIHSTRPSPIGTVIDTYPRPSGQPEISASARPNAIPRG